MIDNVLMKAETAGIQRRQYNRLYADDEDGVEDVQLEMFREPAENQ